MMPSGKAHAAASTKPPTTRQMVMPMSKAKPYFVISSQPSSTMPTGEARNSLGTNPPSVAMAQPATNSAKKAMP